MTEFIGEIIGTMILIILGDGIGANLSLNKSHAKGGGWIVTSIGWGLAVCLAIFAVGQISGAHINPAVTLGLAAVGEFPWEKVGPYIIAQFIGGFIGATIVWLHFLPHWKETEDQATKLGVFSTSPGVPAFWSNLFSELSGTFILVAGILWIGANEFTEGLNPIAVGFLIMAIGMALGGSTGYAINPARDLAPRFAHFVLPIAGKGSSNWDYAPVPLLGPIIGGILGASFYHAVFIGNPGIVFYIFALITLVIIILAIREDKKLA